MKTVLVVDDNPMSRELVRDGLEGWGYSIIEAENGREAIESVRIVRPDLILLDIQMPVLDGYETLRGIRDDPSSANIPVIAVTAFAMQGDREKALAAGFDAYLTKPIRIALLREEVDRFLQNR